MVAVVADCDDWEDVADFCEYHRPWFALYLDLPPRGTPSHDTFDRFFAQLDADAFEAFFQNFTEELAKQGRTDPEKQVECPPIPYQLI